MPLTPLAFLFLLAGYLVAPAMTPQNPQTPPTCSNTGTKPTSAAKLITTAKSTDCNNDGTKDCGYEEILYPAVFECSTAGSLSGYCCMTYVDFVQKRMFFCDGPNCVTAGWFNMQPFTQAIPVRCVNLRNSTDCTK